MVSHHFTLLNMALVVTLSSCAHSVGSGVLSIRPLGVVLILPIRTLRSLNPHGCRLPNKHQYLPWELVHRGWGFVPKQTDRNSPWRALSCAGRCLFSFSGAPHRQFRVFWAGRLLACGCGPSPVVPHSSEPQHPDYRRWRQIGWHWQERPWFHSLRR